MPQAKRSKDTPLEKSQDTKKIKLDFTNLKPMQTLYVKNLNTKINKQVMIHNLYLLFSAFGDVISINLRQGFAFVIFAGLNLATLALRNLQNEEFFDKLLVINYAVKESSIISRTKTEVLREEEEEQDDEEILPLYE
ncbi:U1 small nuclear ribonucleoprotein A [Candida viswanathii]|uniref:U1 small nuclear ribonucleoprotein A n=1 Tax=Candida viswanathii TaxID=5486 RepID=A0A367Y4X5_9ASCO|nr:U1 small nuclear ribonucleoprotein A [Candida viswanathii]